MGARGIPHGKPWELSHGKKARGVLREWRVYFPWESTGISKATQALQHFKIC